MIIIHLTGGLGNQMFQYAAARALQIKKNCVCKFYFKDSYKDATRKYQLDIFNLIIENASKSEIHSYNPVIGLRNKWKLLFRKKMQYPVYYEKKQFNFDPNSFVNTPGYQFQMQQGQHQLQEQLEARAVELERLGREQMDVLAQKDFLEKEVARLAAEIVQV